MNRVCLLTGASGLLGTAFIERCAARFQIVAVHNRHAIAAATQDQRLVDPLFPARDVGANGHPVYALRTDLGDAGEIEVLVRDVLARFGRVDLLVNAAAVRAWSPVLSPHALEPAEALFGVNVLAPLRLSVALARAFLRSDPNANLEFNRNIVNVSSTAGLFVYPDQGQTLYAASKAALNHLTHHLASEFWDIGVRVNAVAPDTFPGRDSVEGVLDAIIGLDESQDTGRIVTLGSGVIA